jgi:hypothetical protein
MDDRPFRDKSSRPTAKAVAHTLGGAVRFHDQLMRIADGFEREWNHSKASGWMLMRTPFSPIEAATW